MPLMEKKYSTKDVDKGTDELADMKKASGHNSQEVLISV